MNAIRMLWLKLQHGILMDRAAMLDQLIREGQEERERVMYEAAQIRCRININAKRAAVGLRVI
jgi:hypothetical protein